METLQRALEPYRHLDPTGWVGLYRFLPLWGALLAIALGVFMCAMGGGRLFRLVAAPIGAAIGFVYMGTLAGKLGFVGVSSQVAMVSAGVLFVAGLALPPAVLFFAFGVPLGLLGGQFAGPTDWLLGFAPGFVIGGALGVVLHRPVAIALSSGVGAWLVVLGLLAGAGPYTGLVQTLAGTPIVVICIAGCVAIAGIVYQLFVRPSPEEAEKLKRERAQKKQRDTEQKALEDRWANYTKNSKKKPRDQQ